MCIYIGTLSTETTTTSKTAVGLGRGRRPRRARACKQSRILANINLKLSKTYFISSYQELRDLFLFLSYENGIIDDNEFSVLHEEFMPKNPDFSYKEHDRFSLEEMNDAEISAPYNLKIPSRYKILS